MNTLLPALRDGKHLSTSDQIRLTLQLSLPAILSQLSSILMQFIDASMVGQLGANASASIGLVASSTWLFHGLSQGVVLGFTVPVAQSIGAKNEQQARNYLRQGIVIGTVIALLFALCGALAAPVLPRWLKAEEVLWRDASAYFLVFALSVPAHLLNRLAGGMLQASGNMRTPSILMIIMCALDVVFNLLLIFPTRTVYGFTLPGAGLGVLGASLGTALSELVVACIMMYVLLARSPALRLRREEKTKFVSRQLSHAVRIGLPVAVERSVLNLAQIVTMSIIAPLGAVSIAANSFAITVEGLCYMPGYGVQSAAVTLIGQCVGAKRKDLLKRLGGVTVVLGMAIMSVAAAIVYLIAPFVIGLLTPDAQVVELGVKVLRIVVFVEPFFGAAIVAAGVFRGANYSLVSSLLGLATMWGVRVPLTYLVAARFALPGAWVAMSIELAFRGLVFLLFLWRGWWIPKDLRLSRTE